MSLLFQPRHLTAIRNHVKTETRRDWADEYNRPTEGSVQMAVPEMFMTDEDCDCYIRITDVYREPLGEIDVDSANAEGGYSLAQFREQWCAINGEDSWDEEHVVDVVEFEYIGETRP